MWDDVNNKLFRASRDGDVGAVLSCLTRGADINTRAYNPNTPLITAIVNSKLQVVTALLAYDDLDLAATNNDGYTGLQWACRRGFDNFIRQLGQGKGMTREIINAVDVKGNTALMLAVENGELSSVKEMANLEGVDWETKNGQGESLEDVARRLKKEQGQWEMGKWEEMMTFLCKRKRKAIEENDAPRQYKKMKLSKLTQLLEENMETDMKAEEKTLKDKHNKTKKDLKEEYRKKREDLANELKEKSTILNNRNNQETETLANQHKIKLSEKQTLENEIKARVSPYFPAPVLPPAPSCPICLTSMAPPARLYNCPDGHLVCEECKTKVQKCHLCQKPLQGRATAMEQYLRAVYGVE